MTLANLVARTFDRILSDKFMRPIGRKSPGFSGLSFLGSRVIVAQLIPFKLDIPFEKSSRNLIVFCPTSDQYFWKKTRGKPSGSGALSASSSKMAFFISYAEKTASNGVRSTLSFSLNNVDHENLYLASCSVSNCILNSQDLT